jgi:hypothetical protein
MKELQQILQILAMKIRKEYDMFDRLIYVIYYENPTSTGIYTVVRGSCKEVKKFLKRKYENQIKGML